jgi:hypothetical protein
MFILLIEQKNEPRKLTRLTKFTHFVAKAKKSARGILQAIKISTELAMLKHREMFIAF